MLDEKQIKMALIARLKKKGYIDHDAIYIDELTVGSERRADLVVANGKLSAFEIKSDFDNLSRLPGQVSAYKRSFDKVIIVCSEKHVIKTKEITDKDIEVWSVSKNREGNYCWKVARRGRASKTISKQALLSMANKNEVFRLLRESRISVSSKASRYEMVALANSLPFTKIQSYSLSLIKEKYKTYHGILDRNIEMGRDFHDALRVARKFRPGYEPSVSQKTGSSLSKNKKYNDACFPGLFSPGASAIPKGA